MPALLIFNLIILVYPARLIAKRCRSFFKDGQTMDSREMYNATNHLTSLIKWDNDWIHFGTGDEIKFDLIKNVIKEHLNDNDLLLIHHRTNSGQYNQKGIIDRITPILGQEDFQLWTMLMDKVIQFKKMGVLNLGQKK